MVDEVKCPCGSGRSRLECCGPFLAGDRPAPTAEALMRSRYVAFAEGNTDYIRETLHPKARKDHDERATREWSQKSKWLGLEVRSVEGGGVGDDAGKVEFVARYRTGSEPVEHHEIASFVREDGRWYFVDAELPGVTTVVREGPKVGRNDPCPCGSGKKHKKCCGA